MRTVDLFWTAGRFAFAAASVLFLIGIAVGSYCWCVGGGLAAGVQAQLSKPYELSVEAGSTKITDELVAKIRQSEGVIAASPVKDLQVVLETGENSAGMILEGIDEGYLEEDISEGSVFPDKTVMPYIVLNKAGWELLREKDENGEAVQGTDWKNSGISVITETNAVAARICGILDDGQNDAKAFISLSSVKTLAGENGYTGCVAKTGETRYVKDVSGRISAMGLNVLNAVPVEQAGREGKNRETVYLFLLGSAAVFYSVYLYLSSENPANAGKLNEYELLVSVGFCARDVTGVFLIKNLILIGAGFAFGLICYLLVPQMIPPDIRVQINIAFPPSAFGLLAGASAGLAAFLFAGLIQNVRIKRLCG